MELNPLTQIFKVNSKGETTSHLNSLQEISDLFTYLLKNINNEEPSPSIEEKIKVISNFRNIIKENRTIVEFFSENEDKSIYLYLFELYLNKNSTQELKKEIISLIDELRINIQLNKKSFVFLFNNLSTIYRENQVDEDLFFYDNLTLLNSILGETENYVKPRNYLASNGSGKIIFENDKDKDIQLGNSLIFILNFFINYDKDNNEDNTCSLITVNLEKSNIQLILNYKDCSIQIKDKNIDKLPNKEWIS